MVLALGLRMPAHRHAEVLALNNDNGTQGPQRTDQRINGLGCQPFLDLGSACKDIDEPGQLAQSCDESPSRWNVANAGYAVERHQVALAGGVVGAHASARSIRDLMSGYGGVPVLSLAELDFHRGEAVAVLGPNGSGKSTLLQHLDGLLRPTTGTVLVHGQGIWGRLGGALASAVGYLFQDTDQQLFEHTVLREVSYGPRAAGRTRKEAERCALQALTDVGLAGVVQHHPHDLCFRDRRLVALASLMATGPDMWVLDEPTVGLDLRGREVLAGLLRRHVLDGGTLAMATHDEAFAEAVCSRAIRLSAGVAAG